MAEYVVLDEEPEPTQALSADERVRVRASLNEGGLIVTVERILADRLATQARDHEAEVMAARQEALEFAAKNLPLGTGFETREWLRARAAVLAHAYRGDS